MNKEWKDFVAFIQHRFETSDDPHYDDLLIIKQDIMHDGLLRQIALYSYWNDILWSRSLGREKVMKMAIAQIEKEKEE